MKKSKILKLLVSALSLCLIIGAMVGITAMAETGDTKAPEIFSYNVSYSDQLYLYYAVKADLKEGQKIYLQICDADGNALTDEEVGGYDFANPDKEYSAKITKYNQQTVHGNKCYVFVTNGVSAKDINKYEYVKAIIIDSEGNAVEGGESELVEYSVLSYLYQRLYKDGVASATEGDDAIRKDLYMSLAAYGAAAQELLLADELKAGSVDSIRDTKYYVIPGFSTTFTTKTYIRPDSSVLPESEETFVGWKALVYNKDGSTSFDGNTIYKDYSTFEVGAAIIATPVYVVENLGTVVDCSELDDASANGFFDSGITENTTVSVADAGINGDKAIFLNKDDTAGAQLKAPVVDKVDGSDVYVFSMDFKVVEPNGVSNEIYIKDTNGVKIFYILMTKNSNGALCFHENGEGTSYISTAKVNEWANLKIEYYEEKGAYDVTVNGKFLFSGSKLHKDYTAGVAPKVADIGRTNIWIGGSALADYYFDNIASNQIKALVTYEIDNGGVEKFDGKDIPASVTYSSNIQAPTIVEGDNGDRYIHFAGKVASGSGGQISFNMTDENVADANTFIFECDIKTEDLGYVAFYITDPNVGTSGNKYYTQRAPNSNGKFAVGDAKGALNEWCHFKAEYVKYTLQGYTKGYFRITITGDTYGKTVYKYDMHASDTIDLSKATQFIFSHQGASTMKSTYFDNVKITKYHNSDLDYAEANFDNGKLPGQIKNSWGNSYSVADVGDGNNALIFKKVGGDGAQIIYDVVDSSAEGANTAVIKFDLLLKSNVSGSGIEIYPTCSGKDTYLAYIMVENGTVKYLHNASRDYTVEIGALEQWLTIELRYHTDSYDLYVNGEKISTFSGLKYDGPLGDTSTYTYFRFGVSNNMVGDICFDNISLTHIYEAPAEE